MEYSIVCHFVVWLFVVFVPACPAANHAASASFPHPHDHAMDMNMLSMLQTNMEMNTNMEITRGQLNTTYIEEIMSYAHIPGLSIRIIQYDKILYDGSIGYRTIDSITSTSSKQNILNDIHGDPVQSSTIFQIGSITKTFTCIAIMQLVEQGILSLDIDINIYLQKFKLPNINNPYQPSDIITLRHLLTHTSTMGSQSTLTFLSYDTYNSISLMDYVYGALIEDAPFYTSRSWINATVGTTYVYSNIGVTVAGFLIELMSGQSYQSYITNHILKPLGMDFDTVFNLNDLNVQQQSNLLSQTWIYNNTAMDMKFWYPLLTFQEYQDGSSPDVSWVNVSYPYGIILTPAGQLRSSAPSLSHHLSMFIMNGTFNNTRILSSSSITEILRIQYPLASPTGGLIYTYFPLNITNKRTIVGHFGGIIGARTSMVTNLETGIGVIVLSNGDVGSLNDYQSTLVRQYLMIIVNYIFDVFEMNE